MKTLNEFETMLVSGGASTSILELDTVYVTVNRGDGLSIGDSIALGGAAGGIYGLGMVLTGAAGTLSAGEAIAIGTAVGGIIGGISAIVVIAGVNYFWNGRDFRTIEV